MQLARSCLLDLFAPGIVVRRLQIATGYARASLLALRRNLLRNHFPPNRIVTAKTCALSRCIGTARFTDVLAKRMECPDLSGPLSRWPPSQIVSVFFIQWAILPQLPVKKEGSDYRYFLMAIYDIRFTQAS